MLNFFSARTSRQVASSSTTVTSAISALLVSTTCSFGNRGGFGAPPTAGGFGRGGFGSGRGGFGAGAGAPDRGGFGGGGRGGAPGAGFQQRQQQQQSTPPPPQQQPPQQQNFGDIRSRPAFGGEQAPPRMDRGTPFFGGGGGGDRGGFGGGRGFSGGGRGFSDRGGFRGGRGGDRGGFRGGRGGGGGGRGGFNNDVSADEFSGGLRGGRGGFRGGRGGGGGGGRGFGGRGGGGSSAEGGHDEWAVAVEATSVAVPPPPSAAPKEKKIHTPRQNRLDAMDDRKKESYVRKYGEDKMLFHVLSRMPPPGKAISVKHLSSILPPDTIEIICEKFPNGGLKEFLLSRTQIFDVRPVGDDHVLFVTLNPVAARMYNQKQKERHGLMQALGIAQVFEFEAKKIAESAASTASTEQQQQPPQ